MRQVNRCSSSASSALAHLLSRDPPLDDVSAAIVITGSIFGMANSVNVYDPPCGPQMPTIEALVNHLLPLQDGLDPLAAALRTGSVLWRSGIHRLQFTASAPYPHLPKKRAPRPDMRGRPAILIILTNAVHEVFNPLSGTSDAATPGRGAATQLPEAACAETTEATASPALALEPVRPQPSYRLHERRSSQPALPLAVLPL